MIKKIFLILLITSYVIAESNKCKIAKALISVIRQTNRMPHNLATICMKDTEDKKKDMMIIGGIIGLLFAPLAIPMFATAGLSGAALTASGLATLGGGAIAAGGGGMILGSIVLYTASSTIGAIALGSTISADYCDLPDYIYYDVIYDNNGKIFYEGYFYGIVPYGKGTIKINGEYIKTLNGIPSEC